MSVSVKVYIEEEELYLNLDLSETDAERVHHDYAFLEELVALERTKMASTATLTSDTGFMAAAEASNTPTSNMPRNSCTAETETTTQFIWSPACVELLLALYEDKSHLFGSGTMRHSQIWQVIANSLANEGYTVTAAQCQSKLNGLKKTYKKIIDHNNTSGNDRRTWTFFDKMDEIFGATSWVRPRALATEAGPSSAVTPPKKRKINVLEKISQEISERQQEREMKKRERHEERLKKIDEQIKQRESQHREKMEMFNKLLQHLKK